MQVLTRGVPGCVTGIKAESTPQPRVVEIRTAPESVIQIDPCKFGVIHLVVVAEQVSGRT